MSVASTITVAAPADGLASVAADAAPLDASLVKTGLYLITGGGANSLLRFSANGLILVDTKSPGSYRALKSQVRRIAKISDMAVRVVVVTDHHAAHTGNAEDLMAAGATLIAQANAAHRLRAMHTAASPLRVVTYDHDYTLQLGGVEARVLHPGRAQSDDAAVVLFPDLRVVAVGDLYSSGAPQPDFAGGGSLVEWGSALEAVLKLEFDLAVPSSGPNLSRAQLQAFKARIDAFVARASKLVRSGVAKEDFVARLAAEDEEWRLSTTQIDGFYAELLRQN